MEYNKTPMNYKQMMFQKAMQKKRDEADKIKREFVLSGECAKMLKLIHEKRKKKIKPEDIPF